jgi:hypothetical protein
LGLNKFTQEKEMKNITILLSLFGILLSLSGCSTGGPQFLRGNYYYTGDSNCKYSRQLTNTSITCYNSDNEVTGYRNAMTDQQLQMYRHNQQMDQQRSIANQESYDRSIDSINKGNDRLMKTINGF